MDRHFRISPKIVGSFRCVMAKVLDRGIQVRKFEVQSLYYVNFRADTMKKFMKLLILVSYSF